MEKLPKEEQLEVLLIEPCDNMNLTVPLHISGDGILTSTLDVESYHQTCR
jgi:hypothetical protein